MATAGRHRGVYASRQQSRIRDLWRVTINSEAAQGLAVEFTGWDIPELSRMNRMIFDEASGRFLGMKFPDSDWLVVDFV